MLYGGAEMKYDMLLVAFFASCLMAAGELSKKEIKEYSHMIEIDNVENRAVKNRSNNKSEVFTIYFTSDEEQNLKGLAARIAVEVVDRADKEKKPYLVVGQTALRDPTKHFDNYTGRGYFEFVIPYGSFGRLDVKAYAFELGVLQGKTFVPFDAKYDDVKTYEELTGRTATKFPGKIKLTQSFYVTNN